MKVTDILFIQAEKNADNPAFGYKANGQWHTLSFSQYKIQSLQLAASLKALGVGPGTKVASVTFNRPEWNILDMAILLAGGVHVSLYPNFNYADYQHSLDYTDAAFVFATGKLALQQVSSIQKENSKIKEVFSLDNINGYRCIQQLIEAGGQLPAVSETSATENDIAAIYLTSGSTGKSKGALVTHRAIMNTVTALKDIYDIKSDDKAISYAPLCVSSERSLNYFYQLNGICTYYAENMLSIVQNMQEIKPTIFLGSPLLLEKIRVGTIEKAGTLTGFSKLIFNAALDAANSYYPDKNLSLNPLYHLYNRFVYSRIRDVMGGNVRFIMAGGAAIPVDVMKFFWQSGIPVYEGYGMTECHIMSVNSDNRGIKFGTVGPLFKDVEIVLSNEGEILCRSPYLFSGYYKQAPDAPEVFDRFGFFKTGDKGEWIDNKYLKVTGRLKDIFKTRSGKYVAPEMIEKALGNSPYIHQCIITGANQSHISALIVPALAYARQVLFNEQENALPDEVLLKSTKLAQVIQKAIDGFNIDYTEAEQVKNWHIIATPFSIENGQLTPSMKLKRQVIESEYASLITGSAA